MDKIQLSPLVPIQPEVYGLTISPGAGYFDLSYSERIEEQYLQAYFKTLKLKELPELVIVDTKFVMSEDEISLLPHVKHVVSHGLGDDKDDEIESVTTVPVTTVSGNSEVELGVLSQIVSFADAGTLTDNPNPQRERGQQTETPTLNSIAIQCNIEDDLNTLWDELDVVQINDQSEKAKFLDFCEKNIYSYPNGKMECLICGEINVNEKETQSHMAMHFGPKALCSSCGVVVEHVALLSEHTCKRKLNRRRIRINSRKLKCPHYRCNVTGISPLELYDHINEHSGQKLYRCQSCDKAFPTVGELRHHLALRLSCLERGKYPRLPYRRFETTADTAHRSRIFLIHSSKRLVLVKKFLSQKLQHPKRCTICFKYCSNEFKYSRHLIRCIKNYQFRMLKIRINMRIQAAATPSTVITIS